ncbi:MAG: hypothetical protein ACI8S6_002887 [Myxococcota bacterium]|jgi:hypothetical protein
MPSFFRTAEDVRIFFLQETDTLEKKRQYDRLKTIFVQSIRRAGVRGNFFFHRKCGSLGGAPILILEPQGPVDRGIFQEGITRFGETLSGTFHTTSPGHIVFETKKNVSDSSVNKYRREIRRLIAKMTGMMGSGGDDRIKIVTPAEKARRARAQANARREEAAQAREQLQVDRAARAAKKAARSEEEAPEEEPAEEPPTTAARTAEQEAEQARRTEKARVERAAAQQAGVALIEEQWQDQLIAWSNTEVDHHTLEAELLEVEARIAALVDREALLNYLKHRLAPIRDIDGLAAALEELEDEEELDGLRAALSASETPLEDAQVWLRKAQAEAQAEREARQPDIERVREIHHAQKASFAKLEHSRQSAVRAQAESIRDEIRRSSAALEAARRSGDPETVAAEGAMVAEAQAALTVISRLQRADDALRWIASSLKRMEERGQTSAEDFAQQSKLDSSMRQSIVQLSAEVRALRQLGAGSLLGALWDSRPEIAWARPLLEDAVG